MESHIGGTQSRDRPGEFALEYPQNIVLLHHNIEEGDPLLQEVGTWVQGLGVFW